jgi:hypothetical protein
MTLFEMTKNEFRPIEKVSFSEAKILERADLQRILRNQIDVLGQEFYVLEEEFGDWEDSKRRIDLLAIDSEANLVVIELKRTSDGGHMELQAVRYASMISTMTFEQAEEAHAQYLSRHGLNPNQARQKILDFLGWVDPDQEEFGGEVKILLVSEDFGKELTTAVLWLRDHDIDIQCVRFKPYLDGNKLYLDIETIIPLPEAMDYQVKLRKKTQEGKKHKADSKDARHQFWTSLIDLCKTKNTRHANALPNTRHWLTGKTDMPGITFNYTVAQHSCVAELHIDRKDASKNKSIFDDLFKQRAAVEQVFGKPLVWERLDDKRCCRIKYDVESGGYKTALPNLPNVQDELVDAMIRLENTFSDRLADAIKNCEISLMKSE